MKKVFALVLAAAMVLSMSAISFATVENLAISDTAYTASDGVVTAQLNGNNNYKSIYYMLLNADAADGEDDYVAALELAGQVEKLKAKAKWEQNGDLVKDVKIVKKKYANNVEGADAFGHAYFLEISFNTQETTSAYDVYGNVEVKGGGTEADIDVFVTLQRSKANNASIELTNTNRIYKFAENAGANEIPYDEEQEFELYGGAGWFVVDTYGQGQILLSNTVDVSKRAEIEAKYPDVNFYYFNGNGAVFNKIGQLKLVADEDSYLYKIGADGTTLTLVEDAEYDEYDECWVVNTRVLGQYLIADHELEDITEVADPDEGATDSPVNVETGAAA